MRSSGVRAPLAVLAFLFLAVGSPPRDVSGRWAMSWQTHKHGLKKSGWLVIVQRGEALDVTVKGEGELHARGAVAGDTVHLVGRKMLMQFTIDATVGSDAVMRGSLKISGVVKPFTATRE